VYATPKLFRDVPIEIMQLIIDYTPPSVIVKLEMMCRSVLLTNYSLKLWAYKFASLQSEFQHLELSRPRKYWEVRHHLEKPRSWKMPSWMYHPSSAKSACVALEKTTPVFKVIPVDQIPKYV